VSDQGFNFNQPPRREAKKAFEPPPWEKEQFDELAQRKEAERVAAAALAAAAARPVQPETAQPAAAQPEAPASSVKQAAPAEQGPVASTGTAGGDDPRIEAMMRRLKEEEPPFGQDIWKVEVGAGAVLAAIGTVFVVWGIVALAETRGAGVTGSLGGVVLIVFGLVFACVGVWMMYRTLRQRGVL